MSKKRGLSRTTATVRFVGQDVPDAIAFPLMLERFKRQMVIDPATDCWNWTGTPGSNGYGQVTFRCKRYRINRLMYMLVKGPIAKGLLVMHSCDNRQCINPDHLSLGTDKENIQDAIKKGRPHRGTLELRKTHCPQGHAYAEHARIDKNRSGTPRRACRICQRASTRKRAGWPESHLYIDTQKLGQRPCFTHAAEGDKHG